MKHFLAEKRKKYRVKRKEKKKSESSALFNVTEPPRKRRKKNRRKKKGRDRKNFSYKLENNYLTQIIVYTVSTALTAPTSGPQCKICLINSAEFVFMFCGHYAACQECAEKVELSSDRCPVCRQEIVFTRKIYT